ncbi:MAG: hypothetical protein AAF840_09390, partial [Bacteroidota bacterium]
APYLQLLQGSSKADLLFPVAAYNPMAKPPVVDQLNRLVAMGAEQIMEEVLQEINGVHADKNFGVSLNVADDLLGGWTNRYTTDYDNRFKINALVTRGFCTPIFWSSETFTPDLVRSRTRQAIRRTLYWLEHGRPITLAQHLAQEEHATERSYQPANEMEQAWREEQAATDDYAVIFNFLYGDEASASLGMEVFEWVEGPGYLLR